MLEVKVEDKTKKIVLMASAISAIGQVMLLGIVLPAKIQKKAGNYQDRRQIDKAKENAEVEASVEVNALDASELLNMYQA